MFYVNDLHSFSKKLKTIMIKKGIVDSKGNPDIIALYNLMEPDDQVTEEEMKLDRQKVTDKTRKVSNWIKGNNYPKKIEDIINLCSVLDCDLDYFFTDMQAPTHDLQFIQDYTGLESESIEYLCSHLEERELLNILLKKRHFSGLHSAIISYMQTFYKEMKLLDDNAGDTDITDTEKMELAEYRASKRFSELLVNVSKEEELRSLNEQVHTRESIINGYRTGRYK